MNTLKEQSTQIKKYFFLVVFEKSSQYITVEAKDVTIEEAKTALRARYPYAKAINPITNPDAIKFLEL